MAQSLLQGDKNIMALTPSSNTNKIIRKGRTLSDNEVKDLVDALKFAKKGSRLEDEIKTTLLGGVSKMFANEIYKNDRKGVWTTTIPNAEFDDIFMKMVELFFTNLHKFDPDKAKLSTWTFHQMKPVILNPVRTFGNRFNKTHNPASIDKQHGAGDENLTLADKLDDGGAGIVADYFSSKEQTDIMKALRNLPKFERELIMVLMGFKSAPKEWKDNNGKVTQASISRAIGKGNNRMYIKRKVDGAMNLLRKELSKYKTR